ncbi:MAG: cyclic nucleotide-binding domain-containing protein, partial [Rhizobiaceae bacterium]
MAFLETFQTLRSPIHPEFKSPPGRPSAGFQSVTFFPAGTEIYAQGEESEGLYRVEFGAIRIYRLLADGRRQISAFHLAGEI